jgi:hypothetical protein
MVKDQRKKGIVMYIKRTVLTTIFYGSMILAIIGLLVFFYGCYLLLHQDKTEGFKVFRIALLPLLVGLFGLFLYIIQSKKIDYKNDKT